MTSAANEYGAALFEWALETQTLDSVWDGLTTVAEVFEQEPDYVAFLACPAVAKAQRVAALREAFGGRVAEQVVDFLCLLCESGRTGEFADCLDEYEERYRESRRVSTAQVFSSVALSEAQQAELAAALSKKTGRTVTLQCAVDESLLGGVVVELDGKRYDGSVKRRLQVIKEVIQ